MAVTADRIETVQLDASQPDMQHTGPDTLGGRYMRLFWHPVYRSQDLAAGRAVPVRVMGEDFTLYRGESGTPHVLAFRCAHRGTQLSTGWVEGDELRCFYHGWKYDAGGQCVEQPAEPEPFCSRIKIRGYPVEQYLGLIFVYLGEGDPPAFQRYPDLEVGRREVNIYVRRCNFYNDLDNDGIHTYFVHRRPGYDFKEWNGKIPPQGSSEEDEFGLVSSRLTHRGWLNVTHRGMPNIILRKQSPADVATPRREHSIFWYVPIDDEAHNNVQVDITLGEDEPPRPTDSPNWMDPDLLGEEVLAGRLGREHTDFFRTDLVKPIGGGIAEVNGRVTDMVKFQDSVVQTGQGRIANRSTEHLGATDYSVILLRKLWEREMRKLASGQPLKQWHRPDSHIEGL